MLKAKIQKFSEIDKSRQKKYNKDMIEYYKDSLYPLPKKWSFAPDSIVMLCPKCSEIYLHSTKIITDEEGHKIQCNNCHTKYEY